MNTPFLLSTTASLVLRVGLTIVLVLAVAACVYLAWDTTVGPTAREAREARAKRATDRAAEARWFERLQHRAECPPCAEAARRRATEHEVSAPGRWAS